MAKKKKVAVKKTVKVEDKVKVVNTASGALIYKGSKLEVDKPTEVSKEMADFLIGQFPAFVKKV